MLDPIWVITPGMHGAAHNYECVLSMAGQVADLRGKSARTKAVRLYSSFTFQRAGLLANPGLVELAQPQIFNCGLRSEERRGGKVCGGRRRACRGEERAKKRETSR